MSIERTKRPVNKGAKGGKVKFWRKMAVKGYGKKLRNAMGGMNHSTVGGPTDTIAALLKRADISLPEFDKHLETMYNQGQEAKVESFNNVVDVEPIVEGATA